MEAGMGEGEHVIRGRVEVATTAYYGHGWCCPRLKMQGGIYSI